MANGQGQRDKGQGRIGHSHSAASSSQVALSTSVLSRMYGASLCSSWKRSKYVWISSEYE